MPKSTRSRDKKIARNLDNAPHTLLLSALAIAKIPRRTRVNHLGGPAPMLTAVGTARVALWCAEIARSYADASTEGVVDAHLEDARALLADRALADARREEPFATVAESTQPRFILPYAASVPVRMARLAVSAAIMAVIRPGLIRRPVRPAIQETIRLLRNSAVCAGHDDLLVMRRFCGDLDRLLVRTEAEELLIDRLGLTLKFEDVVWRAPQGATLAPAATFILRLGPEAFGLFAKLGNRYTWNVGARDHVLATVPDPWMASAATALIPGHGRTGALDA